MYLVFDIGGSNLRVAVSEDGQSLSEIKSVPTPQSFEEGIQAFKTLAEELRGSETIEAAAGGVTGPLDKLKTLTLNPPHQQEWKGKPLKQELENILNCPVFLENDTALAALGEATQGAGKGKDIVVYMTVSTGVGGARVVNEKIDVNSLGFEAGHQIIVIDGAICDCGGKGHLESYVSGSGLEKIYHQKAENLKDEKVWDEVARKLAVGLNNTIVHWSPDIIILGGAVMQSISLDKVKAYLREDLVIFPDLPEITLAKLGDEVGLYGALKLCKSHTNT